MSRDAERVNALQLAGYVVMQFTYQQLALQPEIVVADVAAGLGTMPPGRVIIRVVCVRRSAVDRGFAYTNLCWAAVRRWGRV